MSLPTIKELKTRYADGKQSPKEAVEEVLGAIKTRDAKVKGYLRVDEEAALKAAGEADTSLPLGGIPIAIKDNMNTDGDAATCASQILKGYTAPYDATVIKKLKEAGAIIVGKTNMDEFAMGSSTEHSSYQKTQNPWDLERAPGGSSGGSAAVVGAGSAVAALGSDTGGSIRQPAAFCGCVGLKPTYGRVSRYGLVAFASSLDQIGPLSQTVEDSALLMNAISGEDHMENTSRPVDVPDFTSKLGQSVKGMKIGIPKEYFIDGIEPEVQGSVQASIDWFKKEGAEIVEVSLPHTDAAVAVYYIIATAEASANLARFDGIRYGNRAKDAKNLLETYRLTRERGFGPEVKRRIILGTYVLSSGYYDAYYNRAQKVRQLIRRDFTEAFEKCDLLLTPTSPSTAFKIGEKTDDPLQMYLADIFTIAVNLAGVCGISLPCGFSKDNMPIGLQLIGPHFDETTLLQAAHAFEQSHDFFNRRPELG